MKKQPKVSSFGFINVDKSSGVTSSSIVNKLKWLSGVPCGHMGTLDPLASGVLPVGIGNATRLFDYFLEKKKEYVAQFTFGVSSDTLDSTGTLVYGGSIPTAEEIEKVLPTFLGEIAQVPPKYSAKNVNGKRGYDLARAGIDFELPAKNVQIYGLDLLGVGREENSYLVRVQCGGGTYIRSLARDIAAALQTNAVMSGLRRTKSGIFEIENAVKIEEITEENIQSFIIPTESVLPYETLSLTAKNKDMIFNGVEIKTDAENGIYKYYQEDKFYGLAQVKGGRAKLVKKLC